MPSARATGMRRLCHRLIHGKTNPADLPVFPLDLYDEPGHLIRRAHQIAVAMFYEKLGRDVTPVQYAVLRMLYECPGPIR